MQEKAFEILKKFKEYNYEAYIVGGYVRDYLLGKKTSDIDIATSATPREIAKIFKDVSISDFSYGSVTLIYKKIKFDVTTFRKEIKYEGHRKPVKIKYISDLHDDLLRRDFTINTLCMDEKGNILDVLGVMSDMENKIIKTVQNPKYKLKEDSLRILRAVRFATILDFEIDNKVKKYMHKYAYLLKDLSKYHQKEELTKIFLSKNKEKGVKIILDLGLDKFLGINNLKDITLCDDIIGIWSVLDLPKDFPFSKLEKDNICKIKELLNYKDIDEFTLYKYGLYLCTVVYDIKKKDKKILNEIYSKLPIYSVKDIKISPLEIAKILNKKPGSFLKDIISNLEKQIVYGNIKNNKSELSKFIINTYS